MNSRVLMPLRKTRHAMRRIKRGRIKRETIWRGAAVTQRVNIIFRVGQSIFRLYLFI